MTNTNALNNMNNHMNTYINNMDGNTTRNQNRRQVYANRTQPQQQLQQAQEQQSQQPIQDLDMHLTRMRMDINELQRQMDSMREWRNTVTPMLQLIATAIHRQEQTAFNNAQQILQQANDLSSQH
jgi:predicted RNase H-like nuclease (RuvC/YqgF family)